MKIGFLTNRIVECGLTDLTDIANWSIANGFQDLEVGPTIQMDDKKFSNVIHETGINISALTYCRNYLSVDSGEAQHHRDQLIKRLEFAGDNGVEKIVTSTGILKQSNTDKYDGYEAIRQLPISSLDAVVAFFEPIVRLAEKKKVKIAVENCPLMGNISISPVMWRELFKRIDSDYFGLTYDPSHLVWQFIDPYKYISEFGNKIFHVHAKDTIIYEEKLKESGFLTDFNWWEYSLPGTGMIDWVKLFTELKKINYQGTISIEHEDNQRSNSIEDVKAGLIQGREFIQQTIASIEGGK